MLKDRIRAVRMQRKITQQSMADMLQMALRSYQHYEEGKTAPPWENIVKIADIFNVPTDFLLGRDDYLKSLGVSVDVSPESPPKHPRFQKNRKIHNIPVADNA